MLSYNAKTQLETLYQASMLSSGVFRSDLTLSYSYNRLGEITQVSRFLGGDAWHEKYTYNTLGQTTAIQSDINTSNSPRITHTYNAAGQIKQTSFPRLTHSGTLGLNLPFTYTIRGWLLKIGDISNPANTSTSSLYPFQAQYTYSLTGNITEAIYRNSTSILGTTTSPQYKYNFQYDKLNRLKAADFTSICILGSRRCGAIIGVDDQNATTTSLTLSQDLGNFTYDANGNLLSLHRRNQSGSTEDNLAYTYSQNRLTSLMDNAYNNLPGYATAWASFQYDANGNLTQVLDEVDYIPQFSAIYDVRNLPTAISHVTGGSASYRYNAAGQRIYKNVNGTVEHYVMNGSEPIAVLNADGTLRYWITSFGRAEKSGSSYVAYYYLKDHLGSTRVVMKEDGTRVEGYDFEPWGGIMPGRSYASGSNTKEKFTGKERDAESGLDYFGARYYHPGIGRWLAVDPLAEKYPSWSPYNYVMNNPLGMVDPDGRCPESLKKEGDTYVCPLTLDGGEINAISDKTYRERREYLAGGDYMLEGLGKGFLYMVAGGAGIYAGGAYLAGAGIETAATSFLTHKTVIQGAQIATEIMASEAGLVGVGGAAAVGAKQVAKEVVEEAVVVAAKGVTNAGEMLGNFGIPKLYTYTNGGKSVFVSPHAMKHLEELAANGAKLGPDYLKLLGQTHQKALHSAIDDVLSRGPLQFNTPYFSGGNKIIFGAPRTAGELPAVKHFGYGH